MRLHYSRVSDSLREEKGTLQRKIQNLVFNQYPNQSRPLDAIELPEFGRFDEREDEEKRAICYGKKPRIALANILERL